MTTGPQSVVNPLLPPPPTADDPLLSPDFLRKLEQLSLVLDKAFAGKLHGERRSTRRGSSVEFADFRNYVHGDDLRYVDWNVYARLEELFLKLYVEEEDLHVHILIDACPISAAPGTRRSSLSGWRALPLAAARTSRSCCATTPCSRARPASWSSSPTSSRRGWRTACARWWGDASPRPSCRCWRLKR
jgi:hypothetical protein